MASAVKVDLETFVIFFANESMKCDLKLEKKKAEFTTIPLRVGGQGQWAQEREW